MRWLNNLLERPMRITKTNVLIFAGSNRVACWREFAGARSNSCIILNPASFPKLAKSQRELLPYLPDRNIGGIRKRAEFVMSFSILYGVDIRGDVAPASLKLMIFLLALITAGIHPGRRRPGLIEAIQAGSGVYPGQPDIRGDVAPASLKPMPSSTPSRWRMDIRGDVAPASLKPLALDHTTICHWAHPGRRRPGLIEASGPGWPHRRRDGTSGATSPRPH